MAWQSVNSDTFKPRLSSAELTALQAGHLPDGVTDALSDLVTQVVDEVRGYVQAGGNTLGVAGTLPSRLVSAALSIVRFRLATRLPVASLSTDARRREYEDAMRLLERVAEGRFAVEEPTTGDTESVSGTGPSMTERTRYFDRTSQDGI
jgi:phage gp36-like protein